MNTYVFQQSFCDANLSLMFVKQHAKIFFYFILIFPNPAFPNQTTFDLRVKSKYVCMCVFFLYHKFKHLMVNGAINRNFWFRLNNNK